MCAGLERFPASFGTPGGGIWTPRAGWIGAGLLAASVGLAVGTLAYAYFATHPWRLPIRVTPDARDLPYENITFTAADGVRLSGWLIPASPQNDKRAVVIVCHGYPMNREEMLPHAALLREAGFTTLLFDFRALGESEGDLCSVGHLEVHDLRGALDYLQSRADTAELPVGALGHSLGGAVAIMAAARDARLRAVVAEASYPDLKDALEARFRMFLGPASKLITHPISRWASRWIPVDPCDVSPIRDIAAIAPRAVLLIQGQKDLLVRWQDAEKMYEAAQEPRELWLLKKASHARCLAEEPQEYARRVGNFFTQHLIPPT